MSKSTTKHCKACGAEIPDNARVCMYCNSRVETKKKKKPVGIVLVIILWIAVLAALCAVGYYVYQRYAFFEIPASSLVKVNFSGSDNEGEAYLTLNEDSDYFKASADAAPYLTDVFTSAGDNSEALQMQNALRADIYIASDPDDENFIYNSVSGSVKASSLSKISGISNGDTLTVTVRYNEDALKKYRIRLTDTVFTVDVSELASARRINPLSDIYVNLTGADGFGTASVNTSRADSAVVSNFSFEVTSADNGSLSNGDVVRVTAVCTNPSYNGQNQTFEFNGQIYSCAKTLSQEYSVSGLGEIKELDPFEGVEPQFSGISPYVSVTGADTSDADDLIKTYFKYEFSKTSGLKAGEVITCKASFKDDYDEEDLKQQGYTLQKKKRTYVVDSVGEYVTKIKKVDLTLAKSKIAEELAAFEAEEKTLVNAYFCLNKSGLGDTAFNKYFEIYKIKMQGGIIFRIIELDNLYLDSSGKLNFTVSETARNSSDKSVLIDQFVKGGKNYTVKELKTE